jgi:hypothetical protein
MASDPWNSGRDGLYIVAAVRATATALDFTNAFYTSIYIRIKATDMSLDYYGYFNLG